MTCPKCSRTIEDPGARACSYCGLGLEREAADAATPEAPVDAARAVAEEEPQAQTEAKQEAEPPAVVAVEEEEEQVAPEPEPPVREERKQEPSPKPARAKAKDAGAPPAASKPEPPLQEPRRVAASGDETPRRAPELRFSRTQLGNYNAVDGNNNIINNTYVRIQKARPGLDREDGRSIRELLSDLSESSLADLVMPAIFADDVRSKAESLRSDRLLLIACSDFGVARAAATGVIDRLDFDASHRKVLNLEHFREAGCAPRIYELTAELRESEGETVIVVDATGTSVEAQQFVNSLFVATAFWDKENHNRLRDAGLSLICVCDPDRIAGRTRSDLAKRPFVCWSFSYLQHVLRPAFPDTYLQLEAAIVKQRAAGAWCSDETEFREQIHSLLGKETLFQTVMQGGPAAADHSAETFPETETPLYRTVVYTATFFPNLSPNDFSRVVSILLGDQTETITITIQQKAEDGTYKPVPVEKEKALVQTWRESSDATLRACHLMTSREKQRTIAFADVGRRDRLRRYFEDNYGIYLQNQFTTLHEKAFFFDTSDAVAASVIRQTVEMAETYPDQFGERWLAELATKAGADGARMKRVSELLLALWKADRQHVVKRIFERLIGSSAQHNAALELLKVLAFLDGLDAYGLMKQLVDRGTDETRDEVYNHLYGELKRLPASATYALLRSLESWLPEAERELSRYSPANLLALHLILEYCVETTANYDVRDYGRWPTKFALLAASTPEAAHDDYAVLVRWLLHPGMRAVVNGDETSESFTRLVWALFCEWVFILLGRAAGSDTAAPAPATPSSFTADDALSVLIEKIIAATPASRQKDLQSSMIDYWEELKDVLALVANLPADPTQHVRREVMWKRELVRKLLTRFRAIQRQLKVARAQPAMA